MNELELLRGEVATLRALVVGSSRLGQLAQLLEAAHARFGERRWTVSHLVDTGVVPAAERISTGKFLAEHAFVAVAGRRLAPAGSIANARAWAVRVDAASSLPGPAGRP